MRARERTGQYMRARERTGQYRGRGGAMLG